MASAETNRSKIVARLTRDGWQLVRHSTEHDICRRQDGGGLIVVPRHRVLSPGVARSIAKKAGWL